MGTSDYLKKEQELLNSIIEVYNKNYFSDFHSTIMRAVALEASKMLDYIVVTKDGSPDTDGADESELKVFKRGEINEKYIREALEEKDEWKIFGHKSFLPLLFSEYTIGKNNIHIN